MFKTTAKVLERTGAHYRKMVQNPEARMDVGHVDFEEKSKTYILSNSRALIKLLLTQH